MSHRGIWGIAEYLARHAGVWIAGAVRRYPVRAVNILPDIRVLFLVTALIYYVIAKGLQVLVPSGLPGCIYRS